MTAFGQDFRYALRALRRTPGFTPIAILTLALGIGANSAIFSVVDRTVLRPVPWPELDRLAVVGWAWGEGRGSTPALTPAQGQLWKDESRSFEAFAIVYDARYVLTGQGEPQQLAGALVSDGYFRALGVAPALGRAFLPEEDIPGGPPVVILSDGLWRRAFGADRGVVGGTVMLDGEPHTVVGVMPPAFAAAAVDILAPLRLVVDPTDQGHNYVAFGRLRPGVTPDGVRAEAAALTARFAAEHPREVEGGQAFDVSSYRQFAVGGAAGPVWMLFGAVGLVLLIACANVANLLLARASARQAELAVRAALGAGRGRVLRHLLAESVLLALAGGAAGLVLAVWGLDAVLALAPAGVRGLDRAALNLPVLGFTLAIALATGVVTGLAGGLRAAGADLATALREGGRARAGGPGRLRARGALVAAEAALSFVLLIGAGLFIASYLRLSSVQLGFEPEGVYTAEVALPPERYGTADATWRFESQVLERVRALPGVLAAASTASLPLERGLNIGATLVAPGERQHDVIEARAVSPDYLRVLGAALLQGREFTEADHAGAPPVALVNEAFVRRFLSDHEPLGARVHVGGDVERTVVGVVRDIKDLMSLRQTARPTVFFPQAQARDGFTRMLNEWFAAAFMVRAEHPAAVAAALRDAIREADPQQPILRMRPLTQVVGAAIARERFLLRLLATFAGLALGLTAVGIYGVVAYTARERTREIGIRVALGAGRASVVRMVVRQGMVVVAVGLALGLGAALALSRLVASMLYEVSPADPRTFTAVGLLLGAVALLACYIPARRAANVDPVEALRAE